MNFSFRVGFRERASTASLIQIGGRVSRGDEFADGEVWDLRLRDDKFRSNPALKVPFNVLDRFTGEELNRIHPAQLATLAMGRELTLDSEKKAATLIKDEEDMEYPSVSKACRVIDTCTRTVIIDKNLVESILKGEKISRRELMNYSVQIWAQKIDKLALGPITQKTNTSGSELYVWPYDYEPDFLGYMKGVLKLEEFVLAGGAII